MKIIGSFVSPYVRKVLVCLELKGLDYEVDPITPFFGNDEFERLSPLRRIPVMIDGDLVLTDSTVICEYLDETYPEPPLLPEGAEGARPRPLARGIRRHPAWRRVHLGAVLPEIRQPARLGRAGRRGADRTVADDGNSRGARLSGGRIAGQRLSVRRRSASPTFPSPASSATPNMPASRSTPQRWPQNARGFVAHVLAHPAFESSIRLEQIQLSASIAGRRQALLDAGARLTAESYGEKEPRRGVMRL